MHREAPSQNVRLRLGWLPRAELVDTLQDAGVSLNPHALTLLAGPAFESTEDRTVDVTLRSVGAVGLRDGAVLADVMEAARAHGLSTCPLSTGPYLRLAMRDQATAPDSVMSTRQAPTASITVASDRPGGEHDPRGFYLRTIDGTPWLRGYRCSDDHLWSPDDVFAFCWE